MSKKQQISNIPSRVLCCDCRGTINLTIAGVVPTKTDQTRKRIERMEEEREQRRKETELKKEARKAEQAKLLAAGNTGDVDFIGMVRQWREAEGKKYRKQHQPTSVSNGNIIVAVRKRPMSEKERVKKDHDSITCFHPKIWLHTAKTKVDGITKFLSHTAFQFDHAFDEDSTTDQIYVATTMPLLDHVISTQGRATCFCYGQTGSGKTYTMSAIQEMLARDLYEELKEKNVNAEVTLAFFELYGGAVQDLLHDRKRCKLLEDGKGEINILGLQEVSATNAETFLRVISEGQSQRTTHMTEANDASSRSHAICQVFLRDSVSGKLKGKLTLVDLAGSERGSDTKEHNSQRRAESSEINTSLLSLKECIRALGQKSSHVPYRGSKLTLLLKDCFSPNSKTTMIATVSPGASSTDHSLNTLRYSDRIKEQKVSRTTPPFFVSLSSFLTSLPSRQVSSSLTKKSSRGPSKSNANTNPTNLPSRERMARIMSALDEEPRKRDSFEQDIDEILASRSDGSSPMEAPEPKDDPRYVIESVSTMSGESSDVEEELDVPSKRWSGDGKVSQAEKAEVHKDARELFDIEEQLRDEHLKYLQDMAKMLQEEFTMIQEMGGAGPDVPATLMDEYAIKLAHYLERKQSMIDKVQSRMKEYKQLAMTE
ncbi:MAG: hypothetical protein SGILL_007136 [Bacillariaceae sp.]